MSRALLFAAILAWPVASAAQPGVADEQVTFARLVEVAVHQSTTMQLAKTNRKLADLGEVIAGAPAEWQVQASFGADRTHQQLTSDPTPPATDTTRYTSSLGVSTQVSTNGVVSLVASGSDQGTEVARDPNAATRMSQTTTSTQGQLILSMRQPLMRGWSQGASVDQHKARLIADAAGFQQAEADAAAIRELNEAYCELGYARATVGVRVSSLKLANDQAALTKKMYDRGTVPESQIKSAQYGVKLREEALLEAQDAAQSASLALRKLAGMEVGPDLGELVPVDELAVDDRTWDVHATLDVALAHNPRIAAAKKGIGIAGVELARRDNAILPQVDLNASGGMVGAGTDMTSAWNSLASPSYTVNGGLSFQWEVGGSARAAASAARLDRTNAKLTAKEAERDVVTQVMDGTHRIRAAQQRSVVAHAAVELATANLSTELALFRNEKSNNVLVFQRQQELDEARLLEARAAADYQIALGNLEYLTGHLLVRFGVEVSVKD